MTQRVELNDPVECDVFIGADRALPSGDQARTCSQCHRATWAHTAACMWCGHDRTHSWLRLLVAVACIALLAVNISPYLR